MCNLLFPCILTIFVCCIPIGVAEQELEQLRAAGNVSQRKAMTPEESILRLRITDASARFWSRNCLKGAISLNPEPSRKCLAAPQQ